MTEETNGEFKTKWKGDITCAHCGQPNEVQIKRRTTLPAQKAEFEEIIVVSKGKQVTLDDVET